MGDLGTSLDRACLPRLVFFSWKGQQDIFLSITMKILHPVTTFAVVILPLLIFQALYAKVSLKHVFIIAF